MKVAMKVSREFLEQMFALGDRRRIVGVRFESLPEMTIEPTAQITFEIEAEDAPADATAMSPTYRREADGAITMLNPGWVTW